MSAVEPAYSLATSSTHYGRVLRPSGGYDVYMLRMRHAWRPPTDVYETEHHVVVRVEVAGMNEADFTITLEDRRLVIAGSRSEPAQAEAAPVSYHNMEINYGEFRTEVLLSWSVQQEAIEAAYQQGFLQVRIPKAAERHIQVRLPADDSTLSP
jgi:HSP20 family molecular chaperone IbpA